MDAFWAAWNRKMEPMLLNSQLADGSWPKEGGGKTSSQGGQDAEVYRTHLCTSDAWKFITVTFIDELHLI